MKAAFRVDASARIGGGHAMRCLTLADALRERGAETLFVTAVMPETLEQRISASGHRLERITLPVGLDRTGDDWHAPALAAAEQQADAGRTLASIGSAADWIVVDHYLLDAAWRRAARDGAERILIIDDLANRPLDCDLLLDQTLGRTDADYAPHVAPSPKMLLGPLFALLRPEFARERPAALERRQTASPVERILISLGTGDLGGVTAIALDAVLAAAPDAAVDVVLGPEARSLADVQAAARANPRITFHLDPPSMAVLMRDADLAIGAAGTTSWERCCVGLPTLTIVLAGNQRAVAAALEKAQASLVVAIEDIADAVRALCADANGLQKMSAAAFALVDGLGRERVVKAVTIPVATAAPRTALALRPAIASDELSLWLWRNDPATRTVSRTTDAIDWSEHQRWFAAALRSDDRTMLIAEVAGKPVGMVRFDRSRDGHEVSIDLAPDQRGSGLGRAILSAACAQLEGAASATRIAAAVRADNLASQRLFEGCGFVHSGDFGEGGFRRYVRTASPSRSRRSA